MGEEGAAALCDGDGRGGLGRLTRVEQLNLA
jgi:hypothetical protein